MMDTGNFYKCEKRLSAADLQACERKLSITLPRSLKELYLACNGGNVYKDCCRTPNPPYQLQVANFIPIKSNKVFNNNPDFLLEGIAVQEWESKRLPSSLLPFARGIGSLFICIDISTGSIYSYDRFAWDDSVSLEDNHANNTVYLFKSLEEFLQALTDTEEEEAKGTSAAEAHRRVRPREGNNRYGQEQAIGNDDIEQLERNLHIRVPAQLKDFVLQANGGMPENNAWLDPSGEYDYVAIHELLPIKYYQKFNNDSNYVMEGIAQNLWKRKLLPETLLPFAIDAGGNYFCIDVTDGNIYFAMFDTWSDRLSAAENRKQNTRFLCDSFNEFISGLVCEDDI